MTKISKVVKMLTTDGWYLFKHGKKHDLYRHKAKDGQLTIPRHGSKELAKGTLHSILKKAGLK